MATPHDERERGLDLPPTPTSPGLSAHALSVRLNVLLGVAFVAVGLGMSFFGVIGTLGGLCLGAGALEAGVGSHVTPPARSGLALLCLASAVLVLLLV